MKTPISRFIIRMFMVAGLSALLIPTFAADANTATNREPHFYSKVPWAVGFHMEGTVTNVLSVDGRIQFHVNGRFWFTQFPPETPKQVMIEVHPKGGFSATVTPDWFVAMTSDWRAGSVQNDKGRLLTILETAAARGTVVKFSLQEAKMDFGTNNFTLLDAKVWRITDVNLK